MRKLTLGETSIFYCWQSDLPEKANRFFIRDALHFAIREINAEGKTTLHLDEDNMGSVGAPLIPDVLLSKISACCAFVCDLSIIDSSANRPMPNPNVMFELGYAVKCHTWQRIIGIVNHEFGDYKHLPFDLGWRGSIGYRLSPTVDKSVRAAELKQFQGRLKAAINGVVSMSRRPSSEWEYNQSVAHQLRDAITVVTFPVVWFLRDKMQEGQYYSFNQIMQPGTQIKLEGDLPGKEHFVEMEHIFRSSKVTSACDCPYVKNSMLPWIDWLCDSIVSCRSQCELALNRHGGRADIRLVTELQNLSKTCEFCFSPIRSSISMDRMSTTGMEMVVFLMQNLLRAQIIWHEVLLETHR